MGRVISAFVVEFQNAPPVCIPRHSVPGSVDVEEYVEENHSGRGDIDSVSESHLPLEDVSVALSRVASEKFSDYDRDVCEGCGCMQFHIDLDTEFGEALLTCAICGEFAGYRF